MSGQEIFGKSPYWKNADNRRLIDIGIELLFSLSVQRSQTICERASHGKNKV